MKFTFKKAEWICATEHTEEAINQYFDYYKTFEISTVDNTVLLISAHSQYAIFINDFFVDCGQYADYEEYQIYDMIDITKYVHIGSNSLKVIQYFMGYDAAIQRNQKSGVIFEIQQDEKIITYSNEECLYRRNNKYLHGEMEYVSAQLGPSFHYISSRKNETYQKCALADKPKNLFKRPIDKLLIEKEVSGKIVKQGYFVDITKKVDIGLKMQNASLNDCHILSVDDNENNIIKWNISDITTSDGIYFILDMGEESVGYLSFAIETVEDCSILIGWGEHINDRRVRSYLDGRNFAVEYFATKGKNEFIYPFKRMGLRYMQVHIYSKSGAIKNFGIRKTYYRLNKGNIKSSDWLVQKIYDVAEHTLECCMHDHYEDCPWREQAMYAMDSRIQMLCGYYTFGEFDFPRESLRIMAKSVKTDGLVELCAPGKLCLTIPSFTAAFVRSVYEYVLYSGDIVFFNDISDTLEHIISCFENRIEGNNLVAAYRGVQYWNFYEWREGNDGVVSPQCTDLQTERYDCILNAFIVDAFRCYAKLSLWAKNDKSYIKYMALADRMSSAIHKEFWDISDGLYRSYLIEKEEKCSEYSELTQALMLYINAVPTEFKDDLMQKLASEKLIPCALSTAIYKYEALLSDSEKYGKYVFDDLKKVFGKMLDLGATTFWETEIGADDFGYAGSLCHGWSAFASYIYGAYGLGIKPIKPGYDEYSLKQCFNDYCDFSGTVYYTNNQFVIDKNGICK